MAALGLRGRVMAARPRLVGWFLVAAGLMGALGGGWLIGLWAFGLVLIVESAGLVGWGLFHDDGLPDARLLEPFASPWAHEVQDVLNGEARRP